MSTKRADKPFFLEEVSSSEEESEEAEEEAGDRAKQTALAQGFPSLAEAAAIPKAIAEAARRAEGESLLTAPDRQVAHPPTAQQSHHSKSWDPSLERPSKGEPCYDMLPVHEGLRLWREQPEVYRLCTLRLCGPHGGKALHADGSVELVGRTSCGMAFNRSQVVVELHRKQQGRTQRVGNQRNKNAEAENQPGVQDEQTAYGHVVSLIRSSVEPADENQFFFCSMDEYEPWYMHDRSRTAPKFRVLTEGLKDNQWHTHVALFSDEDGHFKFKKKIYVGSSRDGMLFKVRFIRWKPDNYYPLGAVVDYYVISDDPNSWLDVLKEVYTLPQLYSRQEEHEAKEECCEPPADKTERMDCTDLNAITIDPEGSRDRDDALSVTSLDALTARVGVHIADVTHYVKGGSACDLEARRRGTSHYTGAEVIHMLPCCLSQESCSLNEGREKLTLSYFFVVKMDEEGQVTEIVEDSGRFELTKIRVKHNLSYEQVEGMANPGRAGHCGRLAMLAGEGGDNAGDSQLVRDLRLLNEIAFAVWRKRVGVLDKPVGECRTLYYHELALKQKDIKHLRSPGTPVASSLVEQLMVNANAAASRFILDSDGKEAMRVQAAPQPSEVSDWLQQHQAAVTCSPYLTDLLRRYGHVTSSLTSGPAEDTAAVSITLPSAMWASLRNMADANDLENLRDVVRNFSRLPAVISALDDLNEIRHPADTVLGSRQMRDRGKLIHSDLCLDSYTRFTSPIRRYVDILVHRHIKRLLGAEEGKVTYSEEERRQMCADIATLSFRQREADREFKVLSFAQDLREEPHVFEAIVSEVRDQSFGLLVPELGQACEVRFSVLGLDQGLPEMQHSVHTAEYSSVTFRGARRVYRASNVGLDDSDFVMDLEPGERDEVVSISGDGVEVDLGAWREAVVAASGAEGDRLSSTIQNMSALGPATGPLREIVCEKIVEGKRVLMPTVSLALSVRRNSTVKVQLSVWPERAQMTPCVQLLCLTPRLDHCVLHHQHVLPSFIDVRARSVFRNHLDVTHYRETWAPLVKMDGINSAVTGHESIVLQGLTVTWYSDTQDAAASGETAASRQQRTRYTGGRGSFSLSRTFCESRGIPLLRKSLYDSGLWHSLLICIREEKEGAKWVGHGFSTTISFDQVYSQVCVTFRLSQAVSPPPDKIASTCSVELIFLELPYRIQLEALRDMDTAALAKAIALSKYRPIQRLYIDPGAARYIDTKVGRMPRPNDAQKDAIRMALESQFSLIQGPPGTGKTEVGVRLAYIFVQHNKLMASRTGVPFKKVLYCGPSNKAVDVVVEKMKFNLIHVMPRLSSLPKLLRIYSYGNEDKDYPVPGEVPVNAMRRGKLDEIETWKLEDVALHHVIRNPYDDDFGSRANEINGAYSKLLDMGRELQGIPCDERSRNRRKKLQRRLKQAKKRYEKLVHTAKREAIAKAEIILCTCIAAAQLRGLKDRDRVVSRSSPDDDDDDEYDDEEDYSSDEIPLVSRSGVQQCIIDECGMATEPETMVPLVVMQPPQVVLVGDHKQLQPIVTEPLAKRLGLDKSLFERYSDSDVHFIQLNVQYRMHDDICSFPRDTFYEGNLETYKGTKERPHEILPLEYFRYFLENFDTEGLCTNELHTRRCNCLWTRKRVGKPPRYRVRQFDEWGGCRPDVHEANCHCTFVRERMGLFPLPLNDDNRVVFLDVEGEEESLSIATSQGGEMSKWNQAEVEQVTRVYLAITRECAVMREHIAVITQYRAQRNEIEGRLKTEFGVRGWSTEKVNVTTAVASQGSEWEVVILSTVRSLPPEEIPHHCPPGWASRHLGFITDEHQVNVALTRAKIALVIVGNYRLLRCNDLWKTLLERLNARGCVLPAHDFMRRPPPGMKSGIRLRPDQTQGATGGSQEGSGR